LRDLSLASSVAVDSFELLVLDRSDWQARLPVPYGLPLARVRDKRVIAAADYPERLVKSLDRVLLEAAERGDQAPSGWRELFDVLIGVRWAHVVALERATGVFWLDALLAQGQVWQACQAGYALDPQRLQQWWQVCAVGERLLTARAPQRAPDMICVYGHMGLLAQKLIAEGDWSELVDAVRTLPRKHTKVANVSAKKKLEPWLEPIT
jgi:hypothetical protein